LTADKITFRHKVTDDDLYGTILIGLKQGTETIRLTGHQTLIGIKIEDPLTGRMIKGKIPGGRKIIHPDGLINLHHRTIHRIIPTAGRFTGSSPFLPLSSIRLGKGDGAIRRTGINNDDLIDKTINRIETTGEMRLFVTNNHAEGNFRNRQKKSSFLYKNNATSAIVQRRPRKRRSRGEREGAISSSIAFLYAARALTSNVSMV
jgi:hypothetical protein